MSDAPLQGVGVLVTRPRAQAAELVAEVERAGGTAICFPVIEIAARDPKAIARDEAALGHPDITIFVSRNAVEFGLEYSGGGRIGVIGPATAEAVRAAGRQVDIQPAGGFDSEHLLGEPELAAVAGKRVRIIRGQAGRELLADELRARGATVDYLAVYERRLPAVDPATLAALAARWEVGDIDVVTAMSVESLENLVTLLPAACIDRLGSTPLVTPAARVIQKALDLYPASRPFLAPGPQAGEMVEAIIALTNTDRGPAT